MEVFWERLYENPGMVVSAVDIMSHLKDDYHLTFRTDEEDAVVYGQIREMRERIHWIMKSSSRLQYDVFAYACVRGYTHVVQMMIDYDVLLYVQNGFERAVRNDSFHVVSLLLRHPLVRPAAYENNAIRISSYLGNVNVVRVLLGDPRVDPSEYNNYAIRYASRNGYVDVVRVLLNDMRVYPCDNNNEAIRFSSQNGHIDVVRELLEDHRVDPTAHDNEALCNALDNGHEEIVQLLLQSPRVSNSLTRKQMSMIRTRKRHKKHI